MTETEKEILLEWELFLRNLTDFVQIAKKMELNLK